MIVKWRVRRRAREPKYREEIETRKVSSDKRKRVLEI